MSLVTMDQQGRIAWQHQTGYRLRNCIELANQRYKRFCVRDLPLWDMLFGTFQNSQTFDGKVGFRNSASARIGDMLLMRDVHRSSKPKIA
jgi:hypothetical protein